MSDQIGPYAFVSLSAQPQRVSTRFKIRSHTGVDGVGLWDLGQAGEPFQVRAISFATTMMAAKAFYRNVKALETANPVTVAHASLQEPGHLYQVIQVKPAAIRAVVLARGPSGNYYARCDLDITLLPIAN